ncbi:MAG: ion transporter [Rhodospirillaceae bacterium]|nr:ion transporter [Rhodospirillaceae bacterium]MYB14513.1 ion transporter [Rhodospirillaceae bacterium]MYG52777.1 ion transporter [Rhodospirillaceae bacterium]MYI48807.1 ion transporter [Rhodospirillaceae bacterium]
MESPRVTRAITAVIVLNAITLGLETSASVMERVGPLLLLLDDVVLAIFVIELLAKLFAFGWRYFTNGWNVFDFIIVGIALAPASGDLTVLRSLRILRVLRLVAIVPSMRKVVMALMAAIPGVSSVIALLALVYYVFAVMVTKLYGKAFPDWFGTVGDSMYSLFQIMTLESWSMGIVRPVMEQYPGAWMVFVPFILMTSFAVINLFIAVIVNAMTEQSQAESAALKEEMHAVTEAEASALMQRMEALQRQMDEIKGMLERR